jgi:3,8-divinyl protochlorophyllide a 8-vinyl-reductase (ferredoxin)
MGRFLKLPFCDLTTNKLKYIFTTFGMSCFNSINALADLVVGYIGAEFGWQ